MNLITLVFSILMILAILTYSRFEVFLDESKKRFAYLNYMQTVENCVSNKKSQNNYDTATEMDEKAPLQGNGDSKAGDSSSPPPPPPTPRLNAKFNFIPFISKGMRTNADKFKRQRELFKRLLHELYGHDPLFISFREKRPNYDDEIIDHLIALSNQWDGKGGIKKEDDLSTIAFPGDESLGKIYYLIMKGTKFEECEDLNDEKSRQRKTKDGVLSLKNLITLQTSRSTISIYLAPRELLQAIYQDKKAVDQIISEREKIFKEYSKEKKSDKKTEWMESLSSEFKNKFGPNHYPNLDEDLIDFSVSGTNPNKYR